MLGRTDKLNMTTRKAKGIGLLSGGLDSILAVKVLLEQDLDLLGLIFVTPFFGPRQGADLGVVTGIPVRPVEIAQKHLEMLKKPLYGYGSQMNPCIDCHALMLREAGRLMEEEGADFLFTGEVLGQRPMSQRRDSLRSVEKLSGHAGRVLRPLSAKLLPPTLVEAEGLVDREKLLDISGRSRKRQMELAERFGVTDYPQPGGGCMLTNEGFVNKLREFFKRYPQGAPRDVELLKWGRHFRLPAGTICAVGRNKADNEKLTAHACERDVLLKAADFPGPTGIIIASCGIAEDLPIAASIVASYSDAPADGTEQIRIEYRHGPVTGSLTVANQGKDCFKELMI
jgi:hypothetical protein